MCHLTSKAIVEKIISHKDKDPNIIALSNNQKNFEEILCNVIDMLEFDDKLQIENKTLVITNDSKRKSQFTSSINEKLTKINKFRD